MALIIEDGTGKFDAESVISVTKADAIALSENWPDWPAAGEQVEEKEAALRQSNRWAESRFGARLRSSVGNAGLSIYATPKSSTQARLFPMSWFMYPDGRVLADGEWLPREWALVIAMGARRARAGTLSPDIRRDDRLIGKTSVTGASKQWAAGTSDEPQYPEIDDAAAPLWRGVGVVAVKG